MVEKGLLSVVFFTIFVLGWERWLCLFFENGGGKMR